MGSFETVLYSIGLVNTCYFYNALELMQEKLLFAAAKGDEPRAYSAERRCRQTLVCSMVSMKLCRETSPSCNELS
jgi:hypothetical protein